MWLSEKQGMNIGCDYLNNFSEGIIKCIYRKYDSFFLCLKIAVFVAFVFTKQRLNTK